MQKRTWGLMALSGGIMATAFVVTSCGGTDSTASGNGLAPTQSKFERCSTPELSAAEQLRVEMEIAATPRRPLASGVVINTYVHVIRNSSGAGGPTTSQMNAQISVLNDAYAAAGYSFNVVSWSISVEMLCYLLFFAAARTGSRAFTLLAALAILAGIALSTLGTESGWHIGRGLSGFFAGHFAWRLRHRKIPAALLLTGTVLPVAFAPAALSYGQFLGVTAFPAAVLLALKLPVLSTRPFRWLGARSYSIYLWHPVIYFALRGYIPDFELVRDAHPALLVAVAFATVLIVSDLSYRWFETPMRHWLRARLAGRPSRAGLAAQSA